MLLRIQILIFFLLTTVGCMGPVTGPSPDMALSATYLELKGSWYDVAHLPVEFQEDCVGSELFFYKMGPEKPTRLIWECSNSEMATSLDGELVAISNDGFKMAFDEESYHEWLSLEFWVLAKSTDGDWMVIGHPSVERLWVLSRTPGTHNLDLGNILHQVELSGYFPLGFLLDRIEVTAQ